jgi:hypothetical protein
MRRIMFSVLAFVCLVAVVLGARYWITGHRVPAGQPPLADLTRGSLDSLKADFNRSADGVRIILLLSPR